MSNLVEKRLYDISDAHDVALANLSLSSNFTESTDLNHNDLNQKLISLASERSKVWNQVINAPFESAISPNSSERASIENLVLDDKGSVCTLEFITIMTSIFEEVDELVEIADVSFLPALSVFSNDLKLPRFDKEEFSSARNFSGIISTANHLRVFDEFSAAQRDQHLIRRIGNFLPELQKISNFCVRVRRLIRHLVYQTFELHSISQTAADSTEVYKDDLAEIAKLVGQNEDVNILIAEAISKLCRVLIELDHVFQSNLELQEGWDLYKDCIFQREEAKIDVDSSCINGNESHGEGPVNIIKIVHVANQDGDPERFDDDYKGFGEDSLHQYDVEHPIPDMVLLQRMLVDLDNSLFSSRSFDMMVRQSFQRAFEASQVSVNETKTKTIVKDMLTLLIDKYTPNFVQEESLEHELVGLYGLCCLYVATLPTSTAPDKKLINRLLSDRYPPVIPLVGEIVFSPKRFLYAFLQLKKEDSFYLDNVKNSISADWIDKIDSTMSNSIESLYRECKLWLMKFEMTFSLGEHILNDFDVNSSRRDGFDETNASIDHDEKLVGDMRTKVHLLLDGVELAKKASNLLRRYLFVHCSHVETKGPIQFDYIARLCSITKTIKQKVMTTNRRVVALVQRAGLRILASDLFKHFEQLRSYIDHHHSMVVEESGDILLRQLAMDRIGTSLGVVESLLKGSSSFSHTRITAIKVATNLCQENHHEFFSKCNTLDIRTLTNDLAMLSDIDESYDKAADCSFLYFHKNIFSSLVKNLLESHNFQLEYIMLALQDPFLMMQRSNTSQQSEDNIICSNCYRSFLINKVIKVDLVAPLANKIEILLRQRVVEKYVNELQRINPKQIKISSFTRFLDMAPFSVCGVFVNIKALVESHLEKAIYNSSTIGHCDTRSHIEMAMAAKHLGLNLVDFMLPMGTTIPCIDLVDIFQNFTEFLSNYNYNMNQQIFVQRAELESRYVKTVGIESVSISLRRHGLGSFASMQFSIMKQIFSDVDTFIRAAEDDLFFSSLSKEQRWYSDQQKSGLTVYPYNRAEQLREDSFKVDPSSIGYILDVCLSSITRIGNALGFCRLIQTSRRIITSRSNMYSLNLSDSNCKSKNVFDYVAEFLDESLSETKSHEQLTVMHMMFPMLCLQYLDASSQSRDMIRKNIRTAPAYYTDDGFALGVAFLFGYFGQNSAIDSLNWYSSTMENFYREEKSLDVKGNESKQSRIGTSSFFSVVFKNEKPSNIENDDETTRRQVLRKRMETRRKEMQMLQFNIQAARSLVERNSSDM